jgi:hypothetical protein
MSTREDETMSVWTAPTPSETEATCSNEKRGDPADAPDTTCSHPWPGSTYIISRLGDSTVITLVNGNVTLLSPGGPPASSGSIYWKCVDINGWLGFRNTVSGGYLGYDDKSMIICRAGSPPESAQFITRPGPSGGFVLLMLRSRGLKPLGVEDGELRRLIGGRQLREGGESIEEGTSWKFIMV